MPNADLRFVHSAIGNRELEMSDQANNSPGPNSRNLSEISHLFLSSVRAKQTEGASPRPQRTPPGRRQEVPIDLTPEEFAQVIGDGCTSSDGKPQDRVMDEAGGERMPPVTAVIAAHLNG